jgi:RNA polymerase subunit RPABC4/transcription elongation factor Spt4
MNCPNCQRSLGQDFKFCPFCGVEVTKNLKCFSCGKQTDPAWVSCPYCGAALKGQGNQHVPQRPPQYNPQDTYVHGRHYSSGSRRHRKKGFLERIFS